MKSNRGFGESFWPYVLHAIIPNGMSGDIPIDHNDTSVVLMSVVQTDMLNIIICVTTINLSVSMTSCGLLVV